jgi:hypothetical protein
MLAKATYRVIHVFPESARSVIEPWSAIIAFMESQLLCHGLIHRLKKAIYLNSVSAFIRNVSGPHLPTRRARLCSRIWGGCSRNTMAWICS